MKKGKEVLMLLKQFICIVMFISFLLGSPSIVKAQIYNESEEETEAQTAYQDMSSVCPLELHLFEEDGQQPDYHYAAWAYNILKERTAIDPMYQNCREVIVIIHQMQDSDEVMYTKSEPLVRTGYLNLLSKETNKYYTIDNVTIHIQREF